MKNKLTQLMNGITVMDAHYVHQGIASIYIVVQGAKVSLIETGTSHSIPYVLSALEELGFTVDDVEYVIPTHIHLDHAAGAGGLLELCQYAQLVIHPLGAAHMINPERLEAGTMAVYGEEKYRQLYGKLKPIEKQRVIIAEDGFELDFNGRTLRFIDTPGHALHHFCIYDPLSDGVFTGDTFGVAYKQLTSEKGEFIFASTTPVHFDPDALLNSIDKIISLRPTFIYLTHFGMITPTQTIISQLIASIKAFVIIADEEKYPIEGRVKRIEAKLMHWLLAQYSKTDASYPLEETKKLLQTDCYLNAQGLDIWLKRLEKNRLPE